MYGGRASPPMGSCAIKYSACMYVHVHLTDFFKNQPDEICSRLSEKASEKAGVLSPRSSKRERKKRKSEEERRRREKEILHS